MMDWTHLIYNQPSRLTIAHRPALPEAHLLKYSQAGTGVTGAEAARHPEQAGCARSSAGVAGFLSDHYDRGSGARHLSPTSRGRSIAAVVAAPRQGRHQHAEARPAALRACPPGDHRVEPGYLA
jgi:hypothetical protein